MVSFTEQNKQTKKANKQYVMKMIKFNIKNPIRIFFALPDRYLLRTKLKALSPEAVIGHSRIASHHLSGLRDLNSTM